MLTVSCALETNQSILLAPRSIARMRLQEASIDELQVRFDGTRRLSFALRLESNDKDRGKKEANDTQRYRKLMEWVTREEC